MNAAYVVLLILLILYIPIWVWVWRKPEAAAKLHLVKYGPCVMIKTHLGLKTMDKVAKYKRFWAVMGFISKVISAILFLLMMYMLVMAIIALPSRIGAGGIGIQYALAIPGFNPMLPLSYGIVALFIAMVFHELGHGIQSRANDCKVDSTGLLYAVVPVGAFCEPNEKELKELPRKPQMSVYAAGITVNTFIAILSIALMLFTCSSMSVAGIDGYEDNEYVGVYFVDADSPAYASGIPTSALITGISEDGITYHPIEVKATSSGVSFVCKDLTIDPLHKYYVQYHLKDGPHTTDKPIQMGAFIKRVSNDSPASEAELKAGTFIYSIAITHDGVTETHYIHNGYDFTELMGKTSPGDKAVVTTVSYTKDGTPETQVHKEVTLTSSGSKGFLGISVTESGFTCITPKILLDRAMNPFYGCTTPFSYIQGLFSYLSGPFNGMDPISDSVKWWYDVPSGDLGWVLMKLFYWIFWLNILLAISNALPAYPFDGGFLFEGGINWLLEKLGMKDEKKRKQTSMSVSGSISSVVLVMFAMLLVAFIV